MSYKALEEAGFRVTIEDNIFELELPNLEGKSTEDKAHERLPDAFRAASKSDAKVVVLSGMGEGPFYSDEKLLPVENFQEYYQIIDETEQYLDAILSVDQPIIAKVGEDGAQTIGASVALASDFVIASDEATFCDLHVPYSVAAGDGGCVVWPLRIGLGRAKEYLLTGKPVSAEKGEEIGLITRSVPTKELDHEVDELAESLAAKSPIGLQFTKKALNQYMHHAMMISGRYSMSLEGFSFSSEDWEETLETSKEEGGLDGVGKK